MGSESALEQVVDYELADRSRAEIACAYRALCAAVLLRTAMVVRAKAPPRKVEIDQQKTAVRWVAGSHGVLRFSDCCEALDMDPGRAREAIGRYARSRGESPINRLCRKPHSRMVFGKKRYASSERSRTDSPVCRVAPCPSAAPGHRCIEAGP